MPEDMQEHELKPAVRKTEAWTDQKNIFFYFSITKKAANHTQFYCKEPKSVTKTFRVHFLARAAKIPATISESLGTAAD